MEKNAQLAKGFQKGALPNDFKEQWERIATILNALGPPKRAGDGWQKVWRGLKFKVKKKFVAKKTVYWRVALANLLQSQKQLNPLWQSL